MTTKRAKKPSKAKVENKGRTSGTASRRGAAQKRKNSRQAPRTSKAWRSWMPERIESIDLLRKTLSRLDETRGALEIGEAIERLRETVDDVNQRLHAMEQKTRNQASVQVGELRDLILKLPAMDSMSALPERALESIDEALERVGLMRRTKHLQEVEEAKRKAQRATLRKIRREQKAKTGQQASEQGAP